MEMTLKRKLARIHYIHWPALGMVYFMAFGAVTELLCGLALPGTGFDLLAFGAAWLFTVLALGQLLAVVRCERKWAERLGALA